MGPGRMTTTPGRVGGSKVSLWLDSGGSTSAGTHLSGHSVSLGITELGGEGRRRPPMGIKNTGHCDHASMEEDRGPKGPAFWTVT